MTGAGSRSPSHEPGAGATHARPVPPDGDDGHVDDDDTPRATDDDRPIDVAPRTGPFEMGAAEAGMATDDDDQE